MTVAVPIERFAGDVIGVLQAEVNLKYIGDVVSSITIGKAGYAYGSADRRADRPSRYQFGIATTQCLAIAVVPVPSAQRRHDAQQQCALVAKNIQGKDVFSSVAIIPGFDWAMIIERPLGEAFEAALCLDRCALGLAHDRSRHGAVCQFFLSPPGRPSGADIFVKA